MSLDNNVTGGIHTVNECVFIQIVPVVSADFCLSAFAVDNLLEMIRFFAMLILNADEYDL